MNYCVFIWFVTRLICSLASRIHVNGLNISEFFGTHQKHTAIVITWIWWCSCVTKECTSMWWRKLSFSFVKAVQLVCFTAELRDNIFTDCDTNPALYISRILCAMHPLCVVTLEDSKNAQKECWVWDTFSKDFTSAIIWDCPMEALLLHCMKCSWR